MRGVVAYTALRLLAFVVPFLVVWALGGNVVVAAVVGAIAGACLSVIFLPRQRAVVAGAIGERVERRRSDPSVASDEDVEDAAVGGDQSDRVDPATSQDSAEHAPPLAPPRPLRDREASGERGPSRI